MITRIDAINIIAEKIKAKTYLEIGCRGNECFRAVRVETKIGIDPFEGGNLRMYSDDFFAFAHEGRMGDIPRMVYDDTVAKIADFEAIPCQYDIIFIDGDHRHPQVAKDVANSLASLAVGGVIVMHDVWPPERHFEDASLCGTVWRAFVREARTHLLVDAYVANLSGDHVGLGVMRVRPNTGLLDIAALPAYDDMVYDQMKQHEHDWMRRLPFEEVLKRLGIG